MKQRPWLPCMILLCVLASACGGASDPADEIPTDAQASGANANDESLSSLAEDIAPDAVEPELDAPLVVEEEPEPEPVNPLLDPESAEMNRRAPDTFRTRFRTSQGDFMIEVHRDWAPLGADRFYNLVSAGFFDDTRFFRVLDGFVAQFGLSGNPELNAAWWEAEIQDEPVRESNTVGRITFAMGGPNSRTTQVFINLGNNARLDAMGFAPFGEVIEGMDVVQRLYGGYGEAADQGRITDQGNAYLDRELPQLDSIIRAGIQ